MPIETNDAILLPKICHLTLNLSEVGKSCRNVTYLIQTNRMDSDDSSYLQHQDACPQPAIPSEVHSHFVYIYSTYDLKGLTKALLKRIQVHINSISPKVM